MINQSSYDDIFAVRLKTLATQGDVFVTFSGSDHSLFIVNCSLL